MWSFNIEQFLLSAVYSVFSHPLPMKYQTIYRDIYMLSASTCKSLQKKKLTTWWNDYILIESQNLGQTNKMIFLKVSV